jgi:hypothetical protein
MRFFLAVIRLASSFSGDLFHTASVLGAQLGRGVAMSDFGRSGRQIRGFGKFAITMAVSSFSSSAAQPSSSAVAQC